MTIVRSSSLAICAAALCTCASAAVAPLNEHQQLARDIYRELVEIDTSPAGDTTRAARAMAERLRQAGFPAEQVKVVAPVARKGNLIARLRGRDPELKPLLLLAHIDVVAASREDWTTEPFKLIERDGYFYGRGTRDNKAMAAIFIANLIRYRQESFTPRRDVIVALTADEEGGSHNGVQWLLETHRHLIDAAYALNEGGRGDTVNGQKRLHGVQASEKIYSVYRVIVRNRGGHSSLPTPDNAIYQLSRELVRLSDFEFPVRLSDVTRGYFRAMSRIESGEVARDMEALASSTDLEAARRLSANALYNATMRTTCVATMLEGGHAENALPQSAQATINCRALPDEDRENVRVSLLRALGDPDAELLTLFAATPAPPSPLTADVMGAIKAVTNEMWPGIPVVPLMSTGSTDSRLLRAAGIPTYGVSGLFSDIADNRIHGRDERVEVASFFESHEFLYRLVKRLTSERGSSAIARPRA